MRWKKEIKSVNTYLNKRTQISLGQMFIFAQKTRERRLISEYEIAKQTQFWSAAEVSIHRGGFYVFAKRTQMFSDQIADLASRKKVWITKKISKLQNEPNYFIYDGWHLQSQLWGVFDKTKPILGIARRAAMQNAVHTNILFQLFVISIFTDSSL